MISPALVLRFAGMSKLWIRAVREQEIRALLVIEDAAETIAVA
jgi:hypothetical protein